MCNQHYRKRHPRPSVTLALKGYHLDGADLVTPGVQASWR
jgi:hypothetical protein